MGSRILYLCPYCGNEVPYAIRKNKKFKDVKCPYCKQIFYDAEIVREKENKK